MLEHFPSDIGSRQARSRLRLRFLVVLDELCPRVREALLSIWTDFKPAYEELVRTSVSSNASHSAQTPSWAELMDDRFLDWYHDGLQASDPTVEQLNRKLSDWAGEFNIDCDWIGEAAISTIDHWTCVPDAEMDPAWNWLPAGIWTPLSEDRQEFTFTDRWDPLAESPAKAEARIRDKMGRLFDRWFKASETTVEESGYEPPPALRREDDHLHWLVRYQLGESPEEILWDATGVMNPQAISSAVHRMAGRIDFPTRDGKSGPRKKP